MTKHTWIALGTVGWLVVAACSGDNSPPQPPPDPQPSGTGGTGGSGGTGGTGGGCNGGTGGTGGGAWISAVGDRGTVLRTFDDRSWQLSYGTPSELDSVACIGNQTGWTVGAGGTILLTTDGGNTWTAATSGVTSALH